MLTFRDELIATDRQALGAIVAGTGMFRPNEVEVAIELVEERLHCGNDSGYFFVVALKEAKVVGYVCYGPISVTLHSYDLYWIVVSRDHQGQGIGRALLSDAERRIAAAGGRQVYIETSGQPLYASTQAFYRRCGYQLEATIRDFYAPGDHKLIYVRRLENAA